MATADAVFTRARDRSDKDRRIIESEPVRRVHRLPQIRLTSATRDRSDQDRRITDSVCDGSIVVDRRGGFSSASVTEATKTAGSLRASATGPAVTADAVFNCAHDRSEVE